MLKIIDNFTSSFMNQVFKIQYFIRLTSQFELINHTG